MKTKRIVWLGCQGNIFSSPRVVEIERERYIPYPNSDAGKLESWCVHQYMYIPVYDDYTNGVNHQRKMLGYITAILPRVVYNPLMFDILTVSG